MFLKDLYVYPTHFSAKNLQLKQYFITANFFSKISFSCCIASKFGQKFVLGVKIVLLQKTASKLGQKFVVGVKIVHPVPAFVFLLLHASCCLKALDCLLFRYWSITSSPCYRTEQTDTLRKSRSICNLFACEYQYSRMG